MRSELEKMAPNVKSVERLVEVEAGLTEAEREAEDTRRESRTAKERFQAAKKLR